MEALAGLIITAGAALVGFRWWLQDRAAERAAAVASSQANAAVERQLLEKLPRDVAELGERLKRLETRNVSAGVRPTAL